MLAVLTTLAVVSCIEFTSYALLRLHRSERAGRDILHRLNSRSGHEGGGHNQGGSRYTKSKKPWKEIYSEKFGNKSDALIRERQIKSRKSREYIETLLRTRVTS